MSATTHGICTHLAGDLVEALGGRAWCVRCDGYVLPDGSVQPRAHVAAPPVKPTGRFERAMTKRIPFYKR